MKPHEGWLDKAIRDLRSSKKLISGNDPICDTAAYHTQQCAEKSLKAFLTYHGRVVDKTHDLQLLLDLCTDIDSSYAELFEAALIINPFSTIFRYPGIIVEPELKDVIEAISYADKILQFTMDKISFKNK